MTNPAEEDYFRRQEAERREDEASDELRKTTQADKAEHERLLRLGRLFCPKCQTLLQPRTLQNVEVLRCVTCSGTWLTEGKLEELGRRDGGPLRSLLTALGFKRAR